MSTQLPDEVLLAILDEASTPASGRTDYRIRQRTMRSVCLASRRLFRLAQPLLWQQVWVDSRDDLAALRACPVVAALGGLTTTYRAELTWNEKAAEVHDLLPNVIEMRLEKGYDDELHLPVLEGFTKLRRLTLAHQRLATTPPLLPHLERLDIIDVEAGSHLGDQWFCPDLLPRLRVLYIHSWLDSDFNLGAQLDDMVSWRMYDQCERGSLEAKEGRAGVARAEGGVHGARRPGGAGRSPGE